MIKGIYERQLNGKVHVVKTVHRLDRQGFSKQKIAMKHIAYIAKQETRDKAKGKVKSFSRGKVSIPEKAINNYKVGLHNSVRAFVDSQNND